MLLISKFKSWLVSAAGLLVLLLLAFLKGRSTMQEEMEAEKRKDVIKETKAVADELVKAANTAKETQAKVSSSSDSSVDSGLLKYTRD